MKIPILNGIYTDKNADYRTSYPRNLVPVPKDTGINTGYLKPADGIVKFTDGVGTDRGGINWDGICYRVMGTKLVKVASNGVVTILGDVGGSNIVVMDYSFDRLIINSGKKLFYYDPTSGLQQVTDVDLGAVIDVLFIDGYTVTTDGEFLVVTELNDPFEVNPLKYGSSEIDPDPINKILELRNEVHALNRYTTEVFRNVGGANFPFQRVDGAQAMKGCVGSRAACVVGDIIMMIGGGRNESISVWATQNGGATKIATREIDIILSGYSEATLSTAYCESRTDKGHQFFYMHLPDQTIVYDVTSSQALETPVWFTLTSGVAELGLYRGRSFVYAYDKWLCGDPLSYKIGYLTGETSSHYGNAVSWQFGTMIMYNDSKGAIFHAMELVCLPSRAPSSDDATVWTEYSVNGVTWSNRRYTSPLARGSLNARIQWLQMGHMSNWRIQRFGGTSDAHMAISRLEAQVEQLYV